VRQNGSLPLGLDLGSSRIRLASAQRTRNGIMLVAVAVRDLPEGLVTPASLTECDVIAAIIEDLCHELGTHERRCVFSLGLEAAAVKFVRFPTMSGSELGRAAQFEAQRFAAGHLQQSDCIVRVHPVDGDDGVQAVGIARADVLSALATCVKRSGLKPIAADHDALAFGRAYPRYDAVLDVGYAAARLHALSAAGPNSIAIDGGGAQVTKAIAADLSIDTASAERRKLLIGTAGAGETASLALATAVASAVAKVRERAPLSRLALVGNGARLIGLAAALEAAASVSADMVPSEVLHGDAYPQDVVNAAAPDWTLAASLAGWGAR
jgi:type IV pilus assembly protein PilM